MTALPLRIAVTGATGYIGRALISRALSEGAEVIAFGRHPPPDSRVEFFPYDLAAEMALESLRNIDVVIHLAAVTGNEQTLSVAAERAAARSLIAAATACKARFVFISSQAARADAPTDYGRCKWGIEQDVLAAGGAVIRPGLVYGGSERALFGSLCRFVRTMPVLPDFRPRPTVQPIHVDDLAEALLKVASTAEFAGTILRIADPAQLSFTELLRAVAYHRLHRTRLFLPLPHWPPRAMVKRLASLFDLRPMETTVDLRKLGLVLRSLHVGLARGTSGSRRLSLEEGRALLAYVLREHPCPSLLRRYVRAIERLRGGAPLLLPRLTLAYPSFLALLDRPGSMDEFRWRLDAAVALAEASPQGAKRFLRVGKPGGRLRAFLAIGGALIREAGWRGMAFLVSPLLREGGPRR